MVNVDMCGVRKKERECLGQTSRVLLHGEINQSDQWVDQCPWLLECQVCWQDLSALCGASRAYKGRGCDAFRELPQRHGYQDAQGHNARFNNLRGLAVASDGSLRVLTL